MKRDEIKFFRCTICEVEYLKSQEIEVHLRGSHNVSFGFQHQFIQVCDMVQEKMNENQQTVNVLKVTLSRKDFKFLPEKFSSSILQ